jgi:hypothetical protein
LLSPSEGCCDCSGVGILRFGFRTSLELSIEEK